MKLDGENIFIIGWIGFILGCIVTFIVIYAENNYMHSDRVFIDSDTKQCLFVNSFGKMSKDGCKDYYNALDDSIIFDNKYSIIKVY